MASVEWLSPWMDLSQRRTHIRCTDSDIRMWRSLDGPVLIMFLGCGSIALPLQDDEIRPRRISGHGPKAVGHVCRASVQMVEIATFSQSIRMCSRDSGDSLQLAQCALWEYWGMSFQKSPIRKAPCRAL